MQIQVHTDSHVKGDAALEARVNAMLEQYLGRFYPSLTRIDVHLADTNAGKGGDDDKHCAIEARMEHERPIGVTHDDENIEKAIRGACDKLKSRLEGMIEQKRRH